MIRARTMAVTINTTTIIIIIIVVTAAVIVVVDGFAIVVHTNIPPTPTLPPLPSSRSPTSTLSSTMEFKSLIPLSLSTTGTWQKGRNQRSLSLVTLRSTTSSTPKPFTTNNDENDNNDDTIISTTTKEKYLQLAQEAYTQYFSSSDTTFNAQSQNQQQQLHQQVMSLEEYLELAMEAWNAANNEGSAAGGQGISSRTTSSGRSDGGDGRNVVPILPIPNKFYASTTSTSSASSKSTSSTPRATNFAAASSVMTSNTTNFTDLQGSSKSRERQIEGQGNADATTSAKATTATSTTSTLPVSPFDTISDTSSTSIIGSFIRGWMGISLGMNDSFFGGELSSSSSSQRNTNSSPISAMLSSIMEPFSNNINEGVASNDRVQNVDSKENQRRQIQLQQKPANEQPKTQPQPQPQSMNTVAAVMNTNSIDLDATRVTIAPVPSDNTDAVFVEKDATAAASVAKRLDIMTNNSGVRRNGGGADNVAATMTMTVASTGVEKRPIDPTSLSRKGGVSTVDREDLPELKLRAADGDETSAPPPPLKGQLRQQQQQSILPSKSQKTDGEVSETINRLDDESEISNASDDVADDTSSSGVVAGVATSSPLAPSNASPLLQRKTSFTPISTKSSVPGSLKGSVNTMSQGVSMKSFVGKYTAKVGVMAPSINMLKVGKQLKSPTGIPFNPLKSTVSPDNEAEDISSSGVLAGVEAPPPLAPSNASFTPVSTKSSVTGPLKGPFNIASKGDSVKSLVGNKNAKVGVMAPSINMLKVGNQLKTPTETSFIKQPFNPLKGTISPPFDSTNVSLTGLRANGGDMKSKQNMFQAEGQQQQASSLPFTRQSSTPLKGSAHKISTKVEVNGRQGPERWGESFKSNRATPWNTVEGATTGVTVSGYDFMQPQKQQTNTNLMSNSGGEFNIISEDTITSSSIGTVFPSSQGSELPPRMKRSLVDNTTPEWMTSPAASSSSLNWATVNGRQEQKPFQGAQFPVVSDFSQTERDVDFSSTGWPESYMGWDYGDGGIDASTISMDDMGETWVSTSLNGIPEPSYFPQLHIGNRIRSTVHGTIHEGFLFTSDESSNGETVNSRYQVTPCIAKRPWSMSELNATVPAKVLAFERGQQLDLQDQQLTLESWELDAKAAAVRRYFEVEIHMFQKFEEKKKFYGALRRQQLQEEDGGDPENEMIKKGDAAIISKAEVTVPTFLRVYADDGSGGPNLNDAITGYGATGFDVWGKVLDPGHEWLVYEGSLNTEVTLSDAMKLQDRMNDGNTYGNANRLYGVQRAMNLPETFGFEDILDLVCRSLLEDLVFLSSCNVVHRDIRPVNILCDSEHKRLRLTNFGNAVDLDPPRVGLDTERLIVDIPVSIANTLAADVFSVALIIFHLLFDVPEIALNRQLKGVGYDLDLWLQKAQAVESTAERFADAFDYLRERRGFWGFLKGAIRPNPMRKKITSDSLKQFDEILALKSGRMKWTEERSKKVAQEEALLSSLFSLPNNDFGEGSSAVRASETEEVKSGNGEVTSTTSSDDSAFDITRVPFTLQPHTRSTSVLTELSKRIEQAAPDVQTTDEAPLSPSDSEYSDLTRIQFSPPRKSSLTDMLTSYPKQRVPLLQSKRESLPEGKYYDITRAPFQRISPQLQEKKGLAIAIRVPGATSENIRVSESMAVKQIVAPAGKLGVVVDTAQNEGPAYVASISDDSPLLGRIALGDLIVAVDDLDVQTLVADEVSKLLLTKSANARRISVLRKIESAKERQVDLGDQLAVFESALGSSIAKMQTLADAKRFENVERWLVAILPHLQQDDVVHYCQCLISDGFDSLEMLEELIADDLYFMKKAHQRVMSRRLVSKSQEVPPEADEQPLRVKKVYTVDEALGVAARKGIEATVAAEKRLSAEKAEKEKRKVAKQNEVETSSESTDDAQFQRSVSTERQNQ